jgi:hypothetical protein
MADGEPILFRRSQSESGLIEIEIGIGIEIETPVDGFAWLWTDP